MKMRKTYEAGKKDKHLKNDEKNDGVAVSDHWIVLQ